MATGLRPLFVSRIFHKALLIQHTVWKTTLLLLIYHIKIAWNSSKSKGIFINAILQKISQKFEESYRSKNNSFTPNSSYRNRLKLAKIERYFYKRHLIKKISKIQTFENRIGEKMVQIKHCVLVATGWLNRQKSEQKAKFSRLLSKQ